jgi:NAD(P)-dependent dehydrogenase (short-subunit alcohol dehydrogenase family)
VTSPSEPRAVIIGASSGLGRCIGVGLGRRGAKVALLARRLKQVQAAAGEAGPGAFAVTCDATDESSCGAAIEEVVSRLGGIDVFVYAAGVGPLARLAATDAGTWRRVLDTNVIGASIATAAVLPHLQASSGSALYLSSVSASVTPPWPGLGAYAVSKAALDKLVEAWRGEHPEVGFTRVVVGDCGGGQGDAMSQFTQGWDMELVGEVAPIWADRAYLSGSLFDVEELINIVDTIGRAGSSVCVRSITLAPRIRKDQPPSPLLRGRASATGQTKLAT